MYEVTMLNGEVVEFDGEYISNNENIRQCVDCGEWYEISEGTLVDASGYILCGDCEVQSDYGFCDYCGYYENDIVVSQDTDEIMCADCADSNWYQCSDCGEWYEHAHNMYRYNDGLICDNCFSNGDYTTCENCGEIFHYDDIHYDGHTGDNYCNSCWNERRDDLSRFVKNYSYKPQPVFFGAGPMFMGIELEENGGRGFEFFEETSERVEIYFKNDCSIECGSGDAIEIVTHPMSMDYIVDKFDMAGLLETASNTGFTSHDNGQCGLHVHVNRTFLGETELTQDYTIAKLLLLFERFFDDKLVPFSRRRFEQLNHWCKKPHVDYNPQTDGSAELCEKIYHKKVYDDRYYAINLQNRHTIEFRLFRGSLKLQTVMASLQLVQVMTEYAKNNNINKIQTCTWEECTQSDYTELKAYMIERGITVEPVKVQEDKTEDNIEHLQQIQQEDLQFLAM